MGTCQWCKSRLNTSQYKGAKESEKSTVVQPVWQYGTKFKKSSYKSSVRKENFSPDFLNIVTSQVFWGILNLGCFDLICTYQKIRHQNNFYNLILRLNINIIRYHTISSHAKNFQNQPLSLKELTISTIF